MNNDYILTRLESFLINDIPEPANFPCISKRAFKKLSYARETIYIIMDKITDNPLKDGWDIIWSFDLELEYYRGIVKTGEAQFMCDVMLETIHEIMKI